ncbi:hypothetical protein DL96DRAFT_1564996 [Flagelloscypha sp. PMI_526]|nr:hypothetical protein DL96DRAFT_1564996 [Flagelloscypha sp. PMI_526]
MTYPPTKLQECTFASINFVLNQRTLYPLLRELANRPHIRLETMERYLENLRQRSKVVTNGSSLTISTSSAPKHRSEIVLPFIMFLWGIVNRSYYESQPVEELQDDNEATSFQKRVQKSGPALVATLYAVPEIYQVCYITYQIFVNGGWTGISVLFEEFNTESCSEIKLLESSLRALQM